MLDALDAPPRARLVAVVHAETSTGALHPLRELGTGAVRLRRAADGRLRDVARRRAARRRRVGSRLRLQLHAEVPRGAARHGAGGDLAARVAADPRARRTPVPFSLDLELLRALLGRAARGVPPHGADPGDLRAARGAAARVEEGLEARWARHAAAGGARCRRRSRERGLELLADPQRQMAPLTAVRVPEGVDGKRRAGAHAGRARDRGRRRARAGRAADVADRPDGPQRQRGRRRRVVLGALDRCSTRSPRRSSPSWHSPGACRASSSPAPSRSRRSPRCAESGADVWVSPEDRALAPVELHEAIRGADAVVAMLHDRSTTAFLDAAGAGCGSWPTSRSATTTSTWTRRARAASR